LLISNYINIIYSPSIFDYLLLYWACPEKSKVLLEKKKLRIPMCELKFLFLLSLLLTVCSQPDRCHPKCKCTNKFLSNDLADTNWRTRERSAVQDALHLWLNDTRFKSLVRSNRILNDGSITTEELAINLMVLAGGNRIFVQALTTAIPPRGEKLLGKAVVSNSGNIRLGNNRLRITTMFDTTYVLQRKAAVIDIPVYGSILKECDKMMCNFDIVNAIVRFIQTATMLGNNIVQLEVNKTYTLNMKAKYDAVSNVLRGKMFVSRGNGNGVINELRNVIAALNHMTYLDVGGGSVPLQWSPSKDIVVANVLLAYNEVLKKWVVASSYLLADAVGLSLLLTKPKY